MSDSLVLLPTYNEVENLPRLLPRLAALEDGIDVLVIDDASPDGTGKLAEDLRHEYAHLSVLHRKKKDGLGRAYVYGFEEAFRRGYRRVVTMDADLSHAAEDVPRLLNALEESDVAVGSRHAPGGGVEGWPFSRHFLSRMGGFYARSMLRLPVSDVTSGFRAYRMETLEELELETIGAVGFVFQVEILKRILDLPGARAVEVPILFKNRSFGVSKLSRRIIVEAAIDVASLAVRRKCFRRRTYDTAARPHRPRPVVSVVIAARPDDSPQALGSALRLDYPPDRLEILVARGCQPSRQRNRAVGECAGDFVLFLDDDSEAEPELVEIFARAFARDPTLAAVGGPATCIARSPFQRAVELVQGEPWLLGKSAARYRALGEPRFTDERELILCNLCVRRTAFEELGGLDERLYPNEENEFLERLRQRGWRMLYRPDAVVRRPPRRTLHALLLSVLSYGRGRALQLRCLPSRTSFLRLLAILLVISFFGLGALGLARGSLLLASPLLLYGLFLLVVTLRLSRRGGIRRGVAASVLGILIHATYACGLLSGLLFSPKANSGRGSISVSRARREVWLEEEEP